MVMEVTQVLIETMSITVGGTSASRTRGNNTVTQSGAPVWKAVVRPRAKGYRAPGTPGPQDGLPR